MQQSLGRPYLWLISTQAIAGNYHGKGQLPKHPHSRLEGLLSGHYVARLFTFKPNTTEFKRYYLSFRSINNCFNFNVTFNSLWLQINLVIENQCGGFIEGHGEI